MPTGHPDGLPDLFLDRSLGRRQVPALLREAGLRLHTLAEVYGVPAEEDVADTDWLIADERSNGSWFPAWSLGRSAPRIGLLTSYVVTLATRWAGGGAPWVGSTP